MDFAFRQHLIKKIFVRVVCGKAGYDKSKGLGPPAPGRFMGRFCAPSTPGQEQISMSTKCYAGQVALPWTFCAAWRQFSCQRFGNEAAGSRTRARKRRLSRRTMSGGAPDTTRGGAYAPRKERIRAGGCFWQLSEVRAVKSTRCGLLRRKPSCIFF